MNQIPEKSEEERMEFVYPVKLKILLPNLADKTFFVLFDVSFENMDTMQIENIGRLVDLKLKDRKMMWNLREYYLDD